MRGSRGEKRMMEEGDKQMEEKLKNRQESIWGKEGASIKGIKKNRE